MMLTAPAKKLFQTRFSGNKTRDYSDVMDIHRPDYALFDYNVGGHRLAPDQFVQETVARFVKPGEAVLELGCNGGNNLLPLAEKGYQTFGVDIAGRHLQCLWQRAKCNSLEKNVQLATWDFAENNDVPWNGTDLPLDMRGRFKALMAVHVLSHLSKKKLVEVMQGLKPFLAPGGVTITSFIKPQHTDYFASGRSMFNGVVQHDDATVNQAFEGLEKLDCSRPFRENEPVLWSLPIQQLHWDVRRKPVEAVKSNG